MKKEIKQVKVLGVVAVICIIIAIYVSIKVFYLDRVQSPDSSTVHVIREGLN